MKTRWATLMAVAALAGCQQGPSVEDAWVRLPAVAGRPAAAYAAIQPGSLDRALVGVTSPAVGRIELHESMTGHGGMGAMRPLERVKLTAHEPTTLAPGGIHAMLFDLKGELRSGGTIPLTFRFDGSQDITVDAKLVGAGDPAPK